MPPEPENRRAAKVESRKSMTMFDTEFHDISQASCSTFPPPPTEPIIANVAGPPTTVASAPAPALGFAEDPRQASVRLVTFAKPRLAAAIEEWRKPIGDGDPRQVGIRLVAFSKALVSRALKRWKKPIARNADPRNRLHHFRQRQSHSGDSDGGDGDGGDGDGDGGDGDGDGDRDESAARYEFARAEAA